MNTGHQVTSMHYGRAGHTATLLPGSKVLVTGGDLFLNYQTSAEVNDSDTNTWTELTPMNTGRVADTANLLPNGTVLVVVNVNWHTPESTALRYMM